MGGNKQDRGPVKHQHKVLIKFYNALSMHSSLIKMENVLSDLGAEDLLSQILLSAQLYLLVENYFSLTSSHACSDGIWQ